MTLKTTKTPVMGQITTELKSQPKYSSKKVTFKNQVPVATELVQEVATKTKKQSEFYIHRPSDKRDLKREKQRLQKEEYRKNNTKTDQFIDRARSAKFARCFASPTRIKELYSDVKLDFQVGFLNTNILESVSPELLANVNQLNDTLRNGVPLKHRLDNSTTALFTEFSAILQDIGKKIPDLSRDGGGSAIPVIGKAITNTVVASVFDVATYGLVLYLLYALFEYEKNRTRKNCGMLLVALTIVVLRSDSFIIENCKDKITGALSHLFTAFGSDDELPKDDLDFQMGSSELNGVIELVSLFVFGKIVGNAPKGDTLSKLFKEVGSFKRSTDGLKDLSSTVMKFIERLVNWVRVEILNTNSISFVESDVYEVKLFVAESMEIADRCHRDDFILNIPNSETIHQLWVRGNVLLNKFSHRDYHELRLQVQTQMTYISKIRAKFVEANLLTLGTRQAPLCVLIRGPSGVGKSAATIPMVTGLLSMILPEEELNDFRANYESFIYGRQAEHVYWDGYRGQYVCAFDDFGQIKDVAGQGENEYSEFIRAGNVFGFILHMADIESKGGVAFRSKICICTTNLNKIQPESIVEPEAVTRRFDIVVDQVPPVEYCTAESLLTGDLWKRRLDKTKVSGAFDEAACEYHELKFNQGDAGRGSYTGKVYSFNELVMKMTSQYREHEDYAAKYKISLEKNVEKHLAMRNLSQLDHKSGFVDTLEYQMNLDDIEEEDKISEYSTESEKELSLVKDPAMLAFLLKVKDTPAADHMMRLVIGLRRKIGVQHINEFDLLSQLVKGSKAMNNFVQDWYKTLPLQSNDLTDKVLGMMTIFISELSCNDMKCKYIYENLNVTMSTVLHDSWTKTAVKFSGFCESYHARVQLALARYPYLQQLVQYVPYGELILTALVTVVGGVITVTAVNACLKGFKMLYQFIIPTIAVGHSIDTVVNGGLTLEHKLEKQSATKARPAHKQGKDFVRGMKHHSKAHSKLETQFGSSDPVLDQILTKVIENNSYELWITETKRAGYITFIKGRVALMPWHFATELAAQIEENPSRADDYCKLKKARSTIEFTVPIITLLDAEQATGFGTQDACLVLFPREVKNHIDITRYFHSEKSANAKRDKKFVLYSPDVDRIKEYHGEHYQTVQNTRVGPDDVNCLFVRTGYRYNATTDKGDCGSLMAAVDCSSGREKILGIHTGGSTKDAHGFSTAICREDLEETLAMFKEEVIETVMDSSVALDYNSDFIMLDSRFVTVGTSEKVVRAPDFTAIGPSRLIGKWQPPKTIPGRLKAFTNKDGVVIDPFKVGLAKYCKKHVMIDVHLMGLIGEHISDDLRRVSTMAVEPRVLTFEEAVIGIENEPDYGSLPRGTSAGFPHNVAVDKMPGKTKWFGKDQTFDLENEACADLRGKCAKVIEDARWNTRHLFIYSDYLKDERRPYAKYEAGNTRIFSACPLEYTIAIRQYFGAFSLWMIKNKTYNGSAIGLNPYSYDWQVLAECLQQFGPKVGAGDYSGFDGSEQGEIHWAILDVINRWYADGEENARIRHVLWLDLVNSRHIRGDLVYEWVSSLPSGHPLTTLVNILYGFFAFRYCWFRAHDNDEKSLALFTKHVYLCELGDDNIYNFSDECAGVFNQRTISSFMAEIGLTYTDEDKVIGSIVEHRPLGDCTFLKRGFRKEPILDRFVAPLAMETILESPYWTTKNNQKDSITKTTTETCLMELALHKKNQWEIWAPKMIKAYEEAYIDKLECTSRSLLIKKSDTENTIW